MNDVFHLRKYYRNLAIGCLLFFAGMMAMSIGAFVRDGETLAAVVLGGLWGFFVGLSVWTLLAYYRESLRIQDRTVTHKGIFRTKSIRLPQIVDLRWRVPRAIVLRSGDAKISVELHNFEPAEQRRLIHLLRRSVPRSVQRDWDRFCYKAAIPLVQRCGERPLGEGAVLLTRHHFLVGLAIWGAAGIAGIYAFDALQHHLPYPAWFGWVAMCLWIGGLLFHVHRTEQRTRRGEEARIAIAVQQWEQHEAEGTSGRGWPGGPAARLSLAISSELKAKIPGLAVGWIAAAVRVAEHDADLRREMEAAAARFRGMTMDQARQSPAIKSLRDAYKALGNDPTRYRGANEALVRRITQGKYLYRVNTVVDTNNLVTLETLYTGGSFDFDRIQPPITFRIGRQSESYAGIGRGDIRLEGLPVFADQSGPFGCTTSDSERAMVWLDTTRILMVFISFQGPDRLDEALRRAASLLERYAGATGVETGIVE